MVHINILTFLFSSKALIINGFIKIENVKILLSTYLLILDTAVFYPARVFNAK